MEIKKFRNNYGLVLIPASHSGIAVGDLVWDPLIGSPVFSYPGMPKNIYTAFLDAGLIDEDEFNVFKKESTEFELIAAQLADKNVDVNSELIAELQHPVMGKIEGNFKLDTISKFNFGELQVRVMDDLLRVKIDQYLELMKEKKWKEYDGRIRRVHMITELYYGSIKLIVEKSLSGNMDAALEKSSVKVVSRSEGGRSVEYSFSHDEVPFAMRIEKVRSFNG
jgi:hypothetical protein